MAYFIAPAPTIYVALHHHRLHEPYLLSIALPRTTTFSTTFETLRKLVVTASKRVDVLRGLKLEEEMIRRCLVDGMSVSWKSSPEQYGVEEGEVVELYAGRC